MAEVLQNTIYKEHSSLKKNERLEINSVPFTSSIVTQNYPSLSSLAKSYVRYCVTLSRQLCLESSVRHFHTIFLQLLYACVILFRAYEIS